jgi:hypothetical protein
MALREVPQEARVVVEAVGPRGDAAIKERLGRIREQELSLPTYTYARSAA